MSAKIGQIFLKALKSFSGVEGTVRRGQILAVSTTMRANDLIRRGLAESYSGPPVVEERVYLPVEEVHRIRSQSQTPHGHIPSGIVDLLSDNCDAVDDPVEEVSALFQVEEVEEDVSSDFDELKEAFSTLIQENE